MTGRHDNQLTHILLLIALPSSPLDCFLRVDLWNSFDTKYLNPFRGFHWIPMLQIFLSVFIFKETERWRKKRRLCSQGKPLGSSVDRPHLWKRVVLSSAWDCGDWIRQCTENSSSSAWHRPVPSLPVVSQTKWSILSKGSACCISLRKLFPHHQIIKILLLFSSSTSTGSSYFFLHLCKYMKDEKQISVVICPSNS